jgi:hypothetical protein
MDEALELSDFLPISYGVHTEEEYVKFLWDAFQSNYEGAKFEFASLAFHLLYMSFVSFSLWQIRLAREQDFRSALVGFQIEAERNLLSANSPFKFYENLKESQIFRFLKLIGCANDQVGEFSKFVKRRNKIAHPSGTVFFNDRDTIESEIAEMMREVRNIEVHMRPVIVDVYKRFLLDCADAEELEYATYEQELEVNFVHKNYASRKDIEFCLHHDIDLFREHVNFRLIAALHATLAAKYPDLRPIAAWTYGDHAIVPAVPTLWRLSNRPEINYLPSRERVASIVDDAVMRTRSLKNQLGIGLADAIVVDMRPSRLATPVHIAYLERCARFSDSTKLLARA